MKKISLLLVVVAIVVSLLTVFSISGCRAEPEVIVETVTETVTETVVETVTEDVMTGYEYYNSLREAAVKGLNSVGEIIGDTAEYPGLPGKGYKLGFANITEGISFTTNIREGILEQAARAGFAEEDVIILDNQFNPTTALQNADIMLAKEPDVFIEFQIDSKINNIIAQKFGEAGIPLLAVDIEIPGASYVGLNSFDWGYKGGLKEVELVETKLGGIDNVDLIIQMENPISGPVVQLRYDGYLQAFYDTYGAEVIDPKVIKADCGIGTADDANKAMTELIPSLPADAEIIVLNIVNEDSLQGAISALQTAGRYDKNKIVTVNGASELGIQMLRDGTMDASHDIVPRTYSTYLVPAACALIQGEPIPGFMFIESIMITLDNVDEYYPDIK